jgi:hypothetical protein
MGRALKLNHSTSPVGRGGVVQGDSRLLDHGVRQSIPY